MAAHRLPAWPLLPVGYDLLVDCGNSVQRVQIKAAQQAKKDTVWNVRCTKRRSGKDLPIEVAGIDYLCVVCTPNLVYVLPVTVLRSPTDPSVLCARLQIYENADRFKPYLNQFAIGSGVSQTAAKEGVLLKSGWKPWEGPPVVVRSNGPRKTHVRLDQAQIQELIRLSGTQTRKALAERYGITPTTVRNYLQGNRKDLRSL